ncbi:hypothetical protein HAX54_021438 [Datura stramonium]|uniref:Cytochrome P450 n=1 Tax=Datura stramonium TaxID=4076 RepID=A0ABS8UUR4_DATST|nr:hypothetical protein [Datura stramonium]
MTFWVKAYSTVMVTRGLCKGKPQLLSSQPEHFDKLLEPVGEPDHQEHRLWVILDKAAKEKNPVELQDLLLRLTFDNICGLTFGKDPETLSPKMPENPFAIAFDSATEATMQRLLYPYFLWRNINGSKGKPRRRSSEMGEEPLNFDEADKLIYLKAALAETLRLYPSVPEDFKYVISDDVLPDGTWVPAGSTVTYSIYSVGRMKTVWEIAWSLNRRDGSRPEDQFRTSERRV